MVDQSPPSSTSEDLRALLQQIQSFEAERERQISVIALTGSENRSRAFLQGFRVVLSKPFEPAELAAAIASVTGRLG